MYIVIYVYVHIYIYVYLFIYYCSDPDWLSGVNGGRDSSAARIATKEFGSASLRCHCREQCESAPVNDIC